MATFPAPPRVIPDSGISPIRLGTEVTREQPSRTTTRVRPWCAHAASHPVCSSLRRTVGAYGNPGSSSRSAHPCPTASAQSPFAPRALPLIPATTGSCAGPDASRPGFGRPSPRASLPLAPSTAGRPDLPAFGPAFSCWSAAPPDPAVRRMHSTSSSPTSSAFISPAMRLGSRDDPAKRLPAGVGLSGGWAFLFVAALQLARSPGRSELLAQPPRALSPELADGLLPPRQSSQLPGRLVDCRGRSFTGEKGSR
jgi:hypothetical protein